MTRNNKKNQRARQRREQGTMSHGTTTGFTVNRPMTQLLTPGRPGRATMRATFQVLSDTSSGSFSMSTLSGFPQWGARIGTLLNNFKFFRVVDASVTYMVTGGAASPYYIVGNVSADTLNTDTTVLAILDDDYAGVANGVEKLVLHPPPSYWRGGLGAWLSTKDETPGPINNAGIFTFVGGGGATPTTVVGWCSIDMVVEFHTM